jgi:hypothetical protein
MNLNRTFGEKVAEKMHGGGQFVGALLAAPVDTFEPVDTPRPSTRRAR